MVMALVDYIAGNMQRRRKMEASEVLNRVKFEKVLVDVVLNNISMDTLAKSYDLLSSEFGDFDFIHRLAGALDTDVLGINSRELTETVIEGLIYDLKGGDHGITGA
jgi:hypothetical protein